MSVSEKNDDEKKSESSGLLDWAIKEAKLGTRYILSKDFKQPENTAQRTITRKRVVKVKYEKVPSLDEIKDIDPNANWKDRDLLYEIGMIAITEKVLQSLIGQNAPAPLIELMNMLKESMKEGDQKSTKAHLLALIEQYGGGSGNMNCHLLRHYLSLLIETYPLPDDK